MNILSRQKIWGAKAMLAGATLAASISQIQAQTPPVSDDPLIEALIQKGILSADEAGKIRAEVANRQTNLVNSLPASKWLISDPIKNIQLFGDVRMRYEYRSVENPSPQTGSAGGDYKRERFRYALRAGLRGDLTDNFNYGFRVETSANPRSPWVTFADDTGKSATSTASGTPSDKSSDGINVGQVYLGWHPTEWYEMTVGKMPMPLYTTPMVWDSDINPEGAFEKFKFTVHDVELFADFGQFDYQDPNPASSTFPTSDTFLLAWQAGLNAKFGKGMSFKIAPVLYTYIGKGNPPSAVPGSLPDTYAINSPYVGQGAPFGLNNQYNQSGINDLLILEIPLEFNFKITKTKLGDLQGRIFGDVSYNMEGDDRARAAYAAGGAAAFPGQTSATLGQNVAYQIGVGIGSAGPVYGPTQGLVYGTSARKHTWETRFYWQHVEQYALDPNLLDSDFFEGRANLQGFYTSFAYSITDAIIGTVRYGYANPIKNNLGTGGSNQDLPGINPIKDYNLVQMDLTWKF